MRSSKRPPRGVKKQRIWLVILSSLLLILVLIAAVCAGVAFYTVNMLQSKLDTVAAVMVDYADVIGNCLTEGRVRAAQYAEIVSESCFSAAKDLSIYQ